MPFHPTNRRHDIMLGCLGLIVTIWVLPSRAETVIHNESFTSLIAADTLLTTADWDTTAGRIHLPLQGLKDVGSLDTTGEAYASAWQDNHLLIANGSDNSLLVINVDEPEIPVLVTSISVGANARQVVVADNRAYVSLGSGLGIQTVDVSAVTAPVNGPRINLDGFTSQTVINGNWAYAAIFNRGVGVVEITDPASPVVLPNADLAALVRALDVQGDYLYLAADNMLTVMSLATPATPDSVASVTVSGTASCVTVDGSLAYVGGAAGLDILDISLPTSPQFLSNLSFGGGTAYNIAVQGDSLFVANGNNGLQIVDISDPWQPRILVSRSASDYFYHTLLHDDLAWASNGAGGLLVLQADPQGLDGSRNIAVSANLNPAGEPLLRAKLTADYADSIRFTVSSDGGTSWQDIAPDDSWLDFIDPGTDLRWRAELVQTGPFPGPLCNNLTLTFEKQHSYAEIVSLGDIPADGGGLVRLTWTASRFDTADADPLVSEYSVYRRYGPDKAPAYPPGSWEYLLTVPADQEATYTVPVPTLADSSSLGTNWTVFFVRARTTTVGVFFDSPPDSGYSVNNLAPLPPTGFIVNRGPTSVQLNWDPATDPDFAHFRLYRVTSPFEMPSAGTLYQVTTGTSFVDITTEEWFYQLTIVNLAGNESQPAPHPTAAGTPPPAGRFLTQNIPNPFNPATRIAYAVPAGGQLVQMSIYDFGGRLVQTLVTGFKPAGEYEIMWFGRDDRGRSVAAGLYTCRLRCGDKVSTMKMTLVR